MKAHEGTRKVLPPLRVSLCLGKCTGPRLGHSQVPCLASNAGKDNVELVLVKVKAIDQDGQDGSKAEEKVLFL